MQLPLPQFSAIISSLKEAGLAAGSEKRRYTRMEVAAKVQMADIRNGKVERRYTAITRDISLGGLGFIQGGKLDRKSELLICLPCGRERLHFISTVSFAQKLADEMYVIGAEFKILVNRTALPAIPEPEPETIPDEPDPIVEAVANAVTASATAEERDRISRSILS